MEKSLFPAGRLLCYGHGPVIITTLRPPEPFVSPFLSFLGAAALVSAPVQPGAAGMRGHYQKVADALAWKEPADQPPRSISSELDNFQSALKLVQTATDRTIRVRIEPTGKEICSWVENGHGVVLVRNDVLYRADYHQMSTGCAIVAFDLKAGKPLWRTSLKGLGEIDHSKYFNRVWMDQVDERVLAVYGKESAGNYVELVDFKTGHTVGNKVFARE
jgi:hypothetical protein